MDFKKMVKLAVRLCLFTVLFLALLGIALRSSADGFTTIFAVDTSASASGSMEKIISFINEAERLKPEKDLTGIIAFGETASTERVPSSNNVPASISSYISGRYTNIADALKLSQSIFNDDTSKRIVLLSDGQENLNSALSLTGVLRSQGIIVDVFEIDNTHEKEVQLVGIDLPQHINRLMEYSVEIIIYSTYDTDALLSVYKNNTIVENAQVSLRKGDNKFAFSDVADIQGSLIYRAEIRASDDGMGENNLAYAYTYIEDIPHILLLDDNGSASEIEKLLNASGVAVTKISPFEAPDSAAALYTYDGVITADISMESMGGFADALEGYVKNLGGGVIVTGGENSYALGGYKDTAMETLLPVDMELKNNEESANLGMLVVLDRSGSMTGGMYGISKMELAKEAAIRAVDTFSENDYLGVIAFDDATYDAVPYGKVGENKGVIKDSIAQISPGGGTSILPALTKAYSDILNSETKIKHILLLTDGQAETNGYDAVLKGMAGNKISLSTVAIGSDSDTTLLKSLAERGNGRYYFTNEFTDLPKIFLKEVMLANGEYLNNRIFYPLAGVDSEILSGVSAVPQLNGYVSSTIKPRADLVLSDDEKNEPILAAWQYGLGRSVAWTSDMKGMWTADWLSSEQGTAIFRNMVSWILRRHVESNVFLSAEPKGKETEFTVTLPYSEDVIDISASLVSPDGQLLDIDLTAVSPTEYKGTASVNNTGAYIANIKIDTPNGTEMTTTGVNIPYSVEYDVRNKKDNILKKLAEATGGRVLTEASEVFSSEGEMAVIRKDITNILLVVALIIFLFDIAIRRFSIIPDKIINITIEKSPNIVHNVKKVPIDAKSEKNTVKENTSALLVDRKRKRNRS